MYRDTGKYFNMSTLNAISKNEVLMIVKCRKKKQKPKTNKQQSIAECNKDEIYSMQKQCKSTAYENEFMDKRRNSQDSQENV